MVNKFLIEFYNSISPSQINTCYYNGDYCFYGKVFWR